MAGALLDDIALFLANPQPGDPDTTAGGDQIQAGTRSFISVADRPFNAIADGDSANFGQITAGQTQLQNTNFPAAPAFGPGGIIPKTGTPVWVDGAGAGGGVLATTIQSVNVLTQTATLAAPAITSAGPTATFTWGTPNGAAFQAAINFGIQQQKNVFVPGTPTGAFIVDQTLDFVNMAGTQQGMRFYGQGSGNSSSLHLSGTTRIINVSGAPLIKAVSPPNANPTLAPSSTISALRLDSFMAVNNVSLPAGDVDLGWIFHINYVINGLCLEDLVIEGNNLQANGILDINSATGQWEIQRVRMDKVPGTNFQIGVQARNDTYGQFPSTQGGNGTLANSSSFGGQGKGFYFLGSQIGVTVQSCKVVGPLYTIGYHLANGTEACHFQANHSEGPAIGYQIDNGANGNVVHGFSRANNLGTAVLCDGQTNRIHVTAVSFDAIQTAFMTKYGAWMTTNATNNHAVVAFYGVGPVFLYRDDTAGGNTFGTGVGEQITAANLAAPVTAVATTEAGATTVVANNADLIPAPMGVAVAAGAGGALTVGTTYYYKIGLVGPDPTTPTVPVPGGQSPASIEVSFTPTAGQQTGHVTFPPTNVQTQVFQSTTPGVYGANSLVGTAAPFATSLDDTGGALSAGTPNVGAGTAIGVYVPGGRTLVRFDTQSLVPGGGTITLVYWLNAASQGLLGPYAQSVPGSFVHEHANVSPGFYRFSIRAFSSAGAGVVNGGAGGAGNKVTGHLIVTRG